MKLYEQFGSKGFHTCITTTFGIDFRAYESIVLPRLRGAGCLNNMLMADARMLTYALDGASTLPQYAGRHYTVVGIGAKGVFHPKITLQLGRQTGRLIVASANMTTPGLAGNLELAGCINYKREDSSSKQEVSGERRLLVAAWQYLRNLPDPEQQGPDCQLKWLRLPTPWLFDTEPAVGPVALSDGTDAALLRSDMTHGIGSRFAALVDERPVKRLIVISPYWDHDLQALKFLIRALEPQETLILIDSEKALFPVKAAAYLPNASLFELGKFSGESRFVHAKAIIAETARADHVLYGSANSTVAALGTDRATGSNEEVCLYRRLPRNSVIASLGLAGMLAISNRLEASTLPAYATEEPLPLEEVSLRGPGQFECLSDTLFWWPPAPSCQPEDIELLDVREEILPVVLAPLSSDTVSPRRYRMNGIENHPVFARLRFPDDSVSAPAIVTVVDKLQETIHEPRSKSAKALAVLLSEETEVRLELLDVLNQLEVLNKLKSAEADQNAAGDPGTRPARDGKDETEGETAYQTLDYDRFMADRHLRSDEPSVTRSSLAGSDFMPVQNFLNSFTIGGRGESNDPIDDAALAQGLDLGDETGDAQEALESGTEFSSHPKAEGAPPQEKNAVRSKATCKKIITAVKQFNERIKERAEAKQLGSFDVLRFRAILMIVAAAGQPGGTAASKKPTALQVLPCDGGAETWPRLIGQLVFSFFGGNCPAIRHLQIEAMHDRISDDILECWATALWAMQACMAATAHKELLKHLNPLVEQTYKGTRLTRKELENGRIAVVFERLNDRFGERLGLNPALINRAHARTIASLFALTKK